MHREFLVWVQGKEKPRMVHRSVDHAIKEAERLCVKEQRKVFVFAVFNEVVPNLGGVIWGGQDKP